MPSGDPTGYSPGHFNRVYDYVIVPACGMAGYTPNRTDIAVYDNPLTVVRELIDSDIAVFDVSANNPTALYGLAIRHALSLPVTLVKDSKTMVPFNTLEFGVIEYDDSLRIDTVQKAVGVLSEALKKSAEGKKERHQLLNRLNIGIPPVFQETFVETKAEEAPKEDKREHLPIISPLPDYVGEAITEAQIEKLKPGDSLFHLNHGRGKVNFIKKMGKDKLANIQFDSGAKSLVISASDFFRNVKD